MSRKGVLSPIHAEVYEPVLEQLAEQGIRMKDEQHVIGIETVPVDDTLLAKS